MATGWAENILQHGACLAPGERVLAVVDQPLREAGEALCRAAKQLAGTDGAVVVLPRVSQPLSLVPTSLLHAAGEADVVVLMRSPVMNMHVPDAALESANGMGESAHLRALFGAVSGGGRGRILAGALINDPVLRHELCADFAAVAQCVEHAAMAVAGADRVRIVTAAGTDLSLQVGGRPWHRDTGIVRAPGDVGNLPGGEVYVAPWEESAEGCLVVDLCAGNLVLSAPVRFWFTRGRVSQIEGGREAELLYGMLGDDPWAWTIGEFGIGANPVARLRGHAAIDEKVRGTVHVALGGNRSFGGVNPAAVHCDCVIGAPQVYLDGRLVQF